MRYALALVLLTTSLSIGAAIVEPELATGVAVPAASTAPDEGDLDAVAAADLAEERGEPVEITSLRTETETVYANPSGTQTLDASAVPVRTRADDGSWLEIDTTLRRSDDGSIAPVAKDSLGRERVDSSKSKASYRGC